MRLSAVASHNGAETGSMGNKVRISLDEPTGDFWIDNGLVVLSEIFGEGEFDIDYILKGLQERLVERSGNTGYFYDLKERKIKNYSMENWVYPTGFFIKSNPNPNKFYIKKCENGYCEGEIKNTKEKCKIKISEDELEKSKRKDRNKEFVLLEAPKRSLNVNFTKTKRRCSICGNLDYVEEAKQQTYPFVVTPNKFGNFYSFCREGIYLCPRCALSGIAGYLAWMYAIDPEVRKSNRKDYMHIFMFHSDVNTLRDIRNGILRKMMGQTENRSWNMPMDFYGEYVHETTLGLLFSVFSYMLSRDEETDPEIEKLLQELDETLSSPVNEIKLYGISGKPGQGFNMSAYREFSRINALYSPI